jgi:nitroimidazol reductase NimA-like FMN-containing flavoprotein (pyridoxamine 5'-phosphate oxidase superfamily)
MTVRMSLTMTRAEREAFLAGVHVAVVSIPDPGRAPLTVPIWYRYEPGGEIEFVTERQSRKGRLLAVGTRLSLCAQTETPPYRYVTVEGVVVAVETSDRERDTRPIAHRYLGADMGDAYVASLGPERGGSVRVRVRPARWLSVDYGKQYG